ncbi:OLC1v1026634C1 [Oldenlandia corymbosa var. corymbosa]|uniref:OLC1v1026634C1 n=1 Tax=Oldenlandia corymbosa var. corymbosa TaxID=529605 RepID=A0AAV1CAA6_OLDCO|nr:OLC1v1026634C1 [Oldenlandia corymbosa var. corymbosa]
MADFFLCATFLGLLAVIQPLYSLTAAPAATASSPYLSATTLFQNYEKMLTSFKIYIYNTPQENSVSTFSAQPISLFYSSLINSQFITQDPEQAHLFYIPSPPDISARSGARIVREIRTNYPYWNRTLGADHFFVASNGVDSSSDRNAVELKKNAVQISIFPTTSGNFIPHKDITLPPLNPSPLALVDEGPATKTPSYLGFMVWDDNNKRKVSSSLVNEMKGDDEFRIESEPLDRINVIKSSKFCLFAYEEGDLTWMVEAMAMGCVPVVLVDHPIQDLPLMDVLRWSEMALVVATRGGVRRLKEVLTGVDQVRYQKMRELGVTASRHLVWNLEPQPHDAFHMVMYQLWLRRHTIRYGRRQWD